MVTVQIVTVIWMRCFCTIVRDV